MKVNRAALAIEHRAVEIVVDQDPGTAAHGVDGLDVPAEKALEGLVERKHRVDRARVPEHEHEAGQRALATPDADAPEAESTWAVSPGKVGSRRYAACADAGRCRTARRSCTADPG